MKRNYTKIFVSLISISVILIYYVVGLKTLQPFSANLPGRHSFPIILLGFVAAGIAVVLTRLFANKIFLRKYTASSILILLLVSSFFLLSTTHNVLHSFEPGKVDAVTIETVAGGARALNAATGVWFLLMTGLLLLYPLACIAEKKSEDILPPAARNISIIITTLAAATIFSIAAFSGLAASGEGRGISLLVYLTLTLVLGSVLLAVYQKNNGPAVLFSMLFASLSLLFFFASLFYLRAADADSLGARPHLPLVAAASLGSALAALFSAGRKFFRPLKSERVYNFSAAAAAAFALVFSLWLTTEVRKSSALAFSSTGTAGGEKAATLIHPFQKAAAQWNLDYCPAGKDAADVNIPLSPVGYCPDVFAKDPSALRVTGHPDTPLWEIGKKIKPNLNKKIRSLAINVKNRSGRLRTIPLYLPIVREIESPGDCARLKKIEFPWSAPAEESDLPTSFPLCAGAEIMSPVPRSCQLLKISLAPASPSSGGGCKSPNYFIPIDIVFGDKNTLTMKFGADKEPVQFPGLDHLEKELWKNLTIGKKISSALLLLINPQQGGTLQDLVDLIVKTRWRSSPVVDRLWVKGWEIEM